MVAKIARIQICQLKHPLYSAKQDAKMIPEIDKGSVRKRIDEIQIEIFFILRNPFLLKIRLALF